MAYQILLSRKDRSPRANLNVYWKDTPKVGDVVSLEVDRQVIKVRITEAREAPWTARDMVSGVEI